MIMVDGVQTCSLEGLLQKARGGSCRRERCTSGCWHSCRAVTVVRTTASTGETENTCQRYISEQYGGSSTARRDVAVRALQLLEL